MLFKIKWMLSALFLAFFLKKIQFPTYFSFPIFFMGLNKVSIGKRVRIFPNSRIEVHGDGEIIIEDNVAIGQSFHITSASRLVIGSGTVISARVFVTNIDHEYEQIGTPILEQNNKISHTQIGKNCFIGMGVAIQAGTTLGDHVIVGSNSVVRGCFPSYCVIAGAPAKIIKRYDPNDSLWKRTDAFGNFI
ncbi:acyltransferase [Vibrio fluvialis]|uniref:acyltransferase n=1 Tax=Vibrio sp. bablab_jr001 TaxID=2755067 RepID=UPI0018F15C7E|nr:acyltransferase [Vibrio sp. bablab_jr001]MBY7825777.1 acyltransferase [Vibrio fluvialis]MBY8254307.1 acyltransferase [Vibrio fluvialis]